MSDSISSRLPARPRKLLLNILALSALGVLMSLGAWQLRRAAWKTKLIANIQLALTAPPVVYTPAPSDESMEARQFKRVSVRGDFLAGKRVFLYSATPSALQSFTQEGYGYSLMKPASVGGKIVFVDLGFIPASLAFQSDNLPSQTVIDGVIRESEPPSTFSPSPDLAKRVFYTADVASIAQALDLKPSETVVSEYIEATPEGAQTGWPRRRDPQGLADGIPNRHLEYALTWFGLAVTLVGVFVAYSLPGWSRRPRPSV